MAGLTAQEKAAASALAATTNALEMAKMLKRPVGNNAAKAAANAAAAKRAAAAATLNQLYAESLRNPEKKRATELLKIPKKTANENLERLKAALGPVVARRKKTNNEFNVNMHPLQAPPTARGIRARAAKPPPTMGAERRDAAARERLGPRSPTSTERGE